MTVPCVHMQHVSLIVDETLDEIGDERCSSSRMFTIKNLPSKRSNQTQRCPHATYRHPFGWFVGEHIPRRVTVTPTSLIGSMIEPSASRSPTSHNMSPVHDLLDLRPLALRDAPK